MTRADNRLEQVKEELILFAPYATSISHLSKLIKGSRSSIYRVFRSDRKSKERVFQMLKSKEGQTPPLLTNTKKKIVLKTETRKIRGVSIKITETNASKEDLEVIEVEVVRMDNEFFKTHHTPQQRIDKSLEICRLALKDYPISEACEICNLGVSTFFNWIKRFAEVKAMYIEVKEIITRDKDDNLKMLSYIALEKQLQERIITTIEKIAIVDKNGKITTHRVIEKIINKEPNLRAIWKVLSTQRPEIYGTEREREKAKEKKSDDTDGSLRVKTTEELEQELLELEEKLKSMDT